MYERFLSLGFLPEQVRLMPAFDVWMIQYAWIVQSINKWHRDNRPKGENVNFVTPDKLGGFLKVENDG